MLNWQDHFKIKKLSQTKINKTEFVLICTIVSNLKINY